MQHNDFITIKKIVLSSPVDSDLRLIGILSGSASALLLVALEWAAQFRSMAQWAMLWP
jgi:hypothetical protein